MQPLVDIVEYVVPGAIIYHQPRDHYYRIMNKTMMKKDKGWEYGWSYQEVTLVNRVRDEMVFEPSENKEIYSRAFTKFDSDWHLAY